MKCPICGEELVRSKKDPNYLLCYNCKKKFKVAQNSAGGAQAQAAQESAQSGQRSQAGTRTQTSRGTQSRRQSRSSSREDTYEEPYEEEHLSNAPIVVLGIAIVVVLGLIVYMLVL